MDIGQPASQATQGLGTEQSTTPVGAPASRAPIAAGEIGPVEPPRPVASAPAATALPATSTALPPTRPSQLHPGQARRGFVVMATLGIRPITSAAASDGKLTQGQSVTGALAIGFKVGRAVLSLGLDLGAIDRLDAFGTYTMSTSLLVVPSLQVAMVRSRDHRVELIGSLRFGAGTTLDNSATLTTTPPNRPVLLMYEIAPAIRFWAHRQFALQLLAGYGGQYKIANSPTGQNTLDGVHSLVTSIGGLGVF